MIGGAAQMTRIENRAPGAAAPRWLIVFALFLTVAVAAAAGAVVFELAAVSARPTTGTDLRLRVLEGLANAKQSDMGARRELAFAFQQTGRNSEALSEYKKVLASSPDDLASLYNSGVLLLGTWRHVEGEKDLLRVLQLAPSHALAAKTLGEYYATKQEFDRLLAVVPPAADAHSDLADLQYLAGLGYEKTGRPALAKSRYRRALSLVPDMAEAKLGLARLRGTK